MKLLLDTHTFIWYVLDSEKLRDATLALINNGDNEVFLSTVSVWEIAIKQSIGNLNLKISLKPFIDQQLSLNNFYLLGIEVKHLAVVATLPLHHRDPFDRLLIAQAISEQLPIVGADAAFDSCAVQRLW